MQPIINKFGKRVSGVILALIAVIAVPAGMSRPLDNRDFSTRVSAELDAPAKDNLQTVISVSSAADLVSALSSVDANPTTSYMVNFAGSITLSSTSNLPVIISSASVTIDGKGNILDGASLQRGFFVSAGNVTIQNLTVQNMLATGGAGGALGGGGGMGAGAGLFIGQSASVSLSNVNFGSAIAPNKSIGGAGGSAGTISGAAGGGGGLGGNGGAGAAGGGGGGGVGIGANGGSGANPAGLVGLVVGGASGGAGGGTATNPGGTGGAAGGGGGAGASQFGGGGGGPSGTSGSNANVSGGSGGFGGGGGGSNNGLFLSGGNGGFGGGGGGGGGSGGFGGGGGGATNDPSVAGFGGGAGGDAPAGTIGGGGGGLGAGGAIFVVGGSLTVVDSLNIVGNQASGGASAPFPGSGVASAGFGFGAGIFLSGNDSANGGTGGALVFAPPQGVTDQISDSIADQSGSGGSGAQAGVWALTMNGAGTLVLSGKNSFSGGVIVNHGMVVVSNSSGSATGSGPVIVSSGATLAGSGSVDSSVNIQSGAFIAPGSGVGTLTVNARSGITWNAGAEILSTLANDGTSSILRSPNGPLTKVGTGSFVFDFQNSGAVGKTYTLATFQSTNVTSADLTCVGLPTGMSASFQVLPTQIQVSLLGTSAPVISSPTTANASTGAAFSYIITASNGPSQFSESGALPPGLSLDVNRGTISGVPTQVGVYGVIIAASNSIGTGSASLTITVITLSPVITSSVNPQGAVGVPFTYSITATNTPTSFGVVGGLPSGLSLNTTTGVISGTPTQTGTSSLVVQASNSNGTGTAPIAITILASLPAPQITSSLTASGIQGSAFSYTISASNNPTTFSVSGSLPSGLSVNATSGVISGTPSQSGLFPVTISAANSSGSGTATLSITIAAPPPSITSSQNVSGVENASFTFTIVASNSPTSYSISGQLPSGLTLNLNTGVISGTPTQSGNFPVSVSASNSSGTGTAPLTIVISAPAPVQSTGGGGGGGAPSLVFFIALALACLVRFGTVLKLGMTGNATMSL